MFEYAISCGEGTLLDYGIADDIEFLWRHSRGNETLILADAPTTAKQANNQWH
jgi:hypothetical protein